ncbi:MAG: sugar phosphate isomerase/epimerase family protein [Bacteroidales bacterium]
MDRRNFTRSFAIGSTAVLTGSGSLEENNLSGKSKIGNLKLCLNAYSFDKPLRNGTMSLDDLLSFCASTGFDAVDPTGYYFKGYPAVPDDDTIFHFKQRAFRLGVDIGCTGVRNDFTWADPVKREVEKKLVKDWIVVTSKLGAAGLRIFAGTLSKEDFKWEKRAEWIAADIAECARVASEYGVKLALQNHNDFLKTADQVITLLGMVNHPSVGLMLDIGSLHCSDPYAEIEKLAPHAYTWQLKEKIFVNELEVVTDYDRIISIVKGCGYTGYLPLETLGDGDPVEKVKALYSKVKSALA